MGSLGQKFAKTKARLKTPWARRRGHEIQSILFACTHNAIRSPMAEALMRHYHPDKVKISSCGIAPEPYTDPFAIAVMAEAGLDITHHAAQSFDEIDGTYDMIIALSPEAMHHAVDLTEKFKCDVLFWRLLDPSYVEGNRESRLEAYREVRDELSRYILKEFPILPPETPRELG